MEIKKQKKTIYFSPLRYPGGKNCLFQFVSSLVIENNFKEKFYAEPYAGGCGLALRLLFEGVVSKIYINDLDNNIYAFWNTILNDTEKFCDWIEDLEISIENWDKFKEIHKNPNMYNELDIAKSTFFLNRTNISGVIKGGVIGGRRQEGKYKLDARFNKADLISRIKKIATKRDQIILSNLDGLDFIESLKNNKEIFIYLDPPYHLKGSELYMNFYKTEDHNNLLNKVKELDNHWIISYDNSDFIKKIYTEYRQVKFDLSQSTSNKVGNEIVIFSNVINMKKSIKYLKNSRKIKSNYINM